jgi:hypothetical protein
VIPDGFEHVEAHLSLDVHADGRSWTVKKRRRGHRIG